MTGAVVHQFKPPLIIEDVPKPEPAHGEVNVKIETSGFCR